MFCFKALIIKSMWNSCSKLGGKALGLNASSSMPDLAHHNKINLPTPCHFHLQRYFLLVKTHSFLSISRSLPAWMACREPWAGELGAPAASEPHIDVSRLQLCGSPRKPPRFPSAHGKRDHTLIFPEQSPPVLLSGLMSRGLNSLMGGQAGHLLSPTPRAVPP